MIFLGKIRNNQHRWEMNRGLLSVGIGLGVLAALAQAAESLGSKPALVNGGDSMVAAAIRLGCAALCHSLFRSVLPTMIKCHERLSLRDLGRVCLSSSNAIALGMTLPMLWILFR